jgi:hypothetical protein
MSGYSGSSNSNGFNASNSVSNFDQNVWKGQSPALQDLYSNAQNLFKSASNNMQGQTNSAVNNANQVFGNTSNALQGQFQGGAYAPIDANALQSNIYSSMAVPSNTQQVYQQIMGGSGNSYGDKLGQAMQDQANIAQNNTFNDIDQRAATAGMGGSSRQGIAQGIAAKDINQNLQSNLAQVGYNSYNQDLTNKLAIANAADSNNVQRQSLLASLLSGKQNAMTGAIGASPTVQNMSSGGANQYLSPFQALSQYGSTIGAPTVLGSGSALGNSWGANQASGSSSGGGVCYITTAITESLGEPDDGPTLTKLRAFRDSYMSKTRARTNMLRKYYAEAPTIVGKIDKSPESGRFYKLLYDKYLKEIVEHIDNDEPEEALKKYTHMVNFARSYVRGA